VPCSQLVLEMPNVGGEGGDELRLSGMLIIGCMPIIITFGINFSLNKSENSQ
jgi:hypothetical protein